MNDREQRVIELFRRASELADPELSRFLEARCHDEETRRRVVEMLAFEAAGSSFLEPPRPAPAGSFVEELAPRSRVGRYRITERVASGGMGTVYAAWQDDPPRPVALKVLRSGWCDESALRRFRAEARVLARLVHPNIAQVFEAGVEPVGADAREPFPSAFEGWPWFAMEFVEGALPITAYSDHRDLGVVERLELLAEVCDAVHHGHQRGVVHRDLKPSNVLVDAAGRPKLIDFGLAAVLEAEQDPAARLTRTGAVIGTLDYMSPQQFRGAGVDTRSDVYALGVILFELLCGRTPFELSSLPLVEAARRVEETPLPDPRRLRPGLPRELAWVLERALAKEPERRYAGVDHLASDMRRFSRHEVLEAGPPGRAYRLAKFVRRNRLAVGASLALALALLVGGVASAIGYVRVREEQGRTLSALQLASEESDKFRTTSNVLTGMFRSVLPSQDGRRVRAFELLDRAREEIERDVTDRPEVQSSLASTLADCYLRLGLAEDALRLADAAHGFFSTDRPRGDRERMQALRARIEALLLGGRCEEARALALEIPQRSRVETEDLPPWFDLRRAALWIEQVEGRHEQAAALLAELEHEVVSSLGAEAPVLVAVRHSRANALRRLGRFEEAVAEAEALLELTERRHGEASFDAARARAQLGTLLVESGDEASALAHLERAADELEHLAGHEHFATLDVQNSLALALRDTGRIEAAGELLGRVVAAREAAFGAADRETLTARRNLASVLDTLEGPHAAIGALREILAVQEREFPAGDLSTTVTMRRLGVQLANVRQLEEARGLLEQARELHLAHQGPDHPETALVVLELAGVAAGESRLEEAELLYAEARALLERFFDPADRRLRMAQANHASVLAGLGRTQESIDLLTELVRRDELELAPSDPVRLQTLCSLGVARYRAGSYDEAEQVFRDALALGEAHFEPSDPVWIVARRDAAQAFMRRGLWNEVLGLLSETLEDGLNAPGIGWEETAFTELCLATALVQAGRRPEAEPILERCHAAYLDHYGPSDPSTQRAAAKLEELRETLVEAAEASLDLSAQPGESGPGADGGR